jgi:tetratricopeptide (TPR) repeat protein
MQINLDPTRWMVSFAGFIVDWILTREWKQIALTSIPLIFLVAVSGLVFSGSRLDKHKLASHYLALGEKEIEGWEQSWAPGKLAAANVQPVRTNDKAEPKELSRFAEVLFRRVQLLEPNERSQFVIAVTMAQRGAVAQAEKMLSKIAPSNRAGYEPAHAWIAQNLLRQPITDENIRLVTHHLREAVKWERVPESLLLIASELFWKLGEPQTAVDLLKQATELNPANGIFLTQLSLQAGNKVLAEQSAVQVEQYFRQELERDPHDLKSRMGLMQVLASNGKLTQAEQVVREGMQIDSAPELTRGLSEVFRLNYLSSLKQAGGTWTGDLQMLDASMRTDPTNPMVAEEIAKLARLNGASPGDDLIKKLQQFLAEGKATAATHAWIAELYLIRKQFPQALPHLEQVVSRLPNAAQYLNNLAYVIDDIAPERREEALAYAQRAVKLEPRSADYYDTLAKVFASLNRRTEAITALESAIERQPGRKDFHIGIVALYEANGNLPMAEQHRAVIKRIAEYEAQAEKAKAEQVEQVEQAETGAKNTNLPASEPTSAAGAQ